MLSPGIVSNWHVDCCFWNVFFTFKLCIFDRELAYQIADQFRVFGKHIGLKDAVIVGGIGEF